MHLPGCRILVFLGHPPADSLSPSTSSHPSHCLIESSAQPQGLPSEARGSMKENSSPGQPLTAMELSEQVPASSHVLGVDMRYPIGLIIGTLLGYTLE